MSIKKMDGNSSDCGDGAKRCEQKRQRGDGVGGESSLTSRRTPLSERLEQTNKSTQVNSSLYQDPVESICSPVLGENVTGMASFPLVVLPQLVIAHKS